MRSKVIFYALGIGVFVLVSIIYDHVANAASIDAGRLFGAMLLVPIFGYFIWLRWDWVPTEGRERVARERQAAREFRQKVEAEKAAALRKDTE